MFFTYVVRPGEAPESRGPQFEPIWEFLMNYNLRAGFLLQALSFVILCVGVFNGGKDPLAMLTFFRALPENFGVTPFSLTLICHGGFIIGTLMIMAFIQMSEDDASIKQCRGYRAGTKFLLQATSLGAVAWCLSMTTFLGATYHFDASWMEEQIGDGSNWLIYFSSRVFDAFALMLYAGGCFFLETYHSEGTSETWGWLCGLAFMLAGTFEVLGLYVINSAFLFIVERLYTFTFGLALILGTMWAFMFEPVCHKYDVKLTQSALRNEYYKSRNAMAFYGPAIVDENGEVDIAAATDQVQQQLNSQMMAQ